MAGFRSVTQSRIQENGNPAFLLQTSQPRMRLSALTSVSLLIAISETVVCCIKANRNRGLISDYGWRQYISLGTRPPWHWSAPCPEGPRAHPHGVYSALHLDVNAS